MDRVGLGHRRADAWDEVARPGELGGPARTLTRPLGKDTASRKPGQTSWQSCRFWEEAGTVILSPNVSDSRSRPGTGPPNSAKMQTPAWQGPGSAPQRPTRGHTRMPGGGNKRAVYVSDIGFETSVSKLGKWGRGLRGPPRVPYSRVALSTSYINGVVAFVGDLFPAGRAGVRVFEGIAEALAAEDVATLCRNDETSILHNL